MAPVTSDIIGTRIAEARARAGLTQSDLAAATSLDRSALAKIERGARRVSALELSRIADEVGERIEWFVTEAPPAIVSHRNRQDPGAPSAELDRLIETVTRNVEFLTERDDRLSPGSSPVLARPTTAEAAEESSIEARQLLGLDQWSPLYDGAGSVAPFGLFVFSFELGVDSADAASVLLPRGGVIVVNGSMRVGRRRLAFAHEVGHCFFADEYTVDWSVAGPGDPGVWESRLDRFARALLLPRPGLEAHWHESLGRGDGVRTAAVRTASRFRVDMATLARRLLEIDAVSAGEAARVRDVRTTRGDIVELNLVSHDEFEAPFLPRMYEQSVLRLYRNDDISAARALDLLMDIWAEIDLPELPTLPESAIWEFIS